MEEPLHLVLVVAGDDHQLVSDCVDTVEESEDRLLVLLAVHLLELVEEDHCLLLDALHCPHEAIVSVSRVDHDHRKSRLLRDVLRQECLARALRAAEEDAYLCALLPVLERLQHPCAVSLGLAVELLGKDELLTLLQEVLTRERILADRVATCRKTVTNVQPCVGS